MSAYLSQGGREQVRSIQRMLDTHVTGMGGRCLGCGEEAPCALSEVAAVAIRRYGILPQRRPGASRPDLVTGTRVARR